MAMQADSSAAPYSPHVVAGAFVKKYYQTLRYTREDAYKFYNDSSILGRSDSNGNIISVTTLDDIKVQLQSTDFTDCLIELETVDSQPSHVAGMLILVAGSFTIDAVKQKFVQSFFLAPQGSGYFVLNDILRIARPSTEVKEVVANHDDVHIQSTTLPAEPETVSIKESTEPNIPPTENIMPVNDEVISPSTNVVSQVKNDVVVETCVEMVSKDIEKVPEAAQAPPPAEEEVPKKTYASIVKTTMESIPPAPAAKPSPRPKPAQNAKKSVSSPSKPAQATNTVPPSEKKVPKTKSPDEPGYSVYVKNLPFEATVEMVGQEFSRFGAIKPGGIQVRKYQLDQFCFGFVEFESQDSMQAAIEESRVYFGSWESYVEEKRTKTRVVDGVVTRGDDNGAGNRFPSGRGGYHGDNYGGQGGFRNNGYNSGGNMVNDYRKQNEYSDRGRGPQGNGYHLNGNGYHQNRNGYPQNGNGYHQNRNGYPQNGNGYHQNGGNQQRRPYNNGNGNGRAERGNGPKQQTPTPVAS